MFTLDEYNEILHDVYDDAIYFSPYKKHQLKVNCEELSRSYLIANGYQYDHHALVRYWKDPGTIDQMAHKDLVRLYNATTTTHHTYQDSEVWRKIG